MIRKTVTISNSLGLHMRAANLFVDAASRFSSRIQVARGDLVVNGKSIMGLLMLAAPTGTSIEIRVEGTDEGKALQDLVELVKSGFGENGAR